MKSSSNKVPPDGGYGWVVAFAYGLNNVVSLPLLTHFGVVFQEAFYDVGLTHTQNTLVVVLNHSIGMLLSLLTGPLLHRFGYRKVAVTGALFASVGVILTSFASTFWTFLICFSILNSLGITAAMTAFTLAINSFFKEKRGRAIGAGMFLTGLGGIVTPLIMSKLMEEFGWRYTILILGSISLHSLVAACMLRPAKWYLKDPPPTDQEMVPLNKNGEVSSTERNGDSITLRENSVKQSNDDSEEQNKTLFKRFVDFFDFTLLSDPVFVNISIGLALAASVETSFSVLLPFILKDMLNFMTDDIANINSIVSLADTLFRGVLPFIGKRFSSSPRVMYIFTLMLIIGIRFGMLFATSFTDMVIVAVAIGITKSLRTFYVYLVIPNYVPIERLPFATGIQMTVNGIFMTILGYSIGKLRESTGSYVIPLFGLNMMCFVTVLIWSAEFIYFKFKKKPVNEPSSA